MSVYLLSSVGAAAGQEAGAGTWQFHFQATSIGQMHGAFPSRYEGANSLPAHLERRVSLTSTVFIKVKLGSRAEAVIDPETAGGKGFGQVTGIAGFTNGEIPRVAGATPQVYVARAYIRLSGPRWTTVAGKFAITDFFDSNTYSHDPRTQFMNWSLMYNGAWDYPADTRGYTVGIVQEAKLRQWRLRAACVMEPTVANGPVLDTRVGRNRGAVAEIEHRLPGAARGGVRVLGYLNAARAGNYRAALSTVGAPDITAVRHDGTKKYGFGINAEYELAKNIGVFGRYGWSDGRTESWAFTEIDRSLSGGVSVAGRKWLRVQDHVGIGMALNGLSVAHRAYLAAGGLGFIVGDGALQYGGEKIVEAYYAFQAPGGLTITAGYQRIANPGYNRDRGPVLVAALRLHWEL